MSPSLIVLQVSTPCLVVVNPTSAPVVSMAFLQDDDILLLTVAIVAAETVADVKDPLKKKRKFPSVWERPWLAHIRIPCVKTFTPLCF